MNDVRAPYVDVNDDRREEKTLSKFCNHSDQGLD